MSLAISPTRVVVGSKPLTPSVSKLSSRRKRHLSPVGDWTPWSPNGGTSLPYGFEGAIFYAPSGGGVVTIPASSFSLYQYVAGSTATPPWTANYATLTAKNSQGGYDPISVPYGPFTVTVPSGNTAWVRMMGNCENSFQTFIRNGEETAQRTRVWQTQTGTPAVVINP